MALDRKHADRAIPQLEKTLKYINDKIQAFEPARYIVETGTDNGWLYEKYSDGTYKATIKITISLDGTFAATGNIYYKDISDVYSVPTFAIADKTNLQSQMITQGCWIGRINVANNALAFRLYRSISTAMTSVIVFVEMEGNY